MIARNRQHWRPEAAEESGCSRELVLLAPMAQIPARDHELWLEPVDQDGRAPLDRLSSPAP